MSNRRRLRTERGTLARQLDMRKVRLAYKRRAALRMVANGAISQGRPGLSAADLFAAKAKIEHDGNRRVISERK